MAYLAFTPKDEFELILDILRRSDDPEDELAYHPEKLALMVARVRECGYATRSPEVEPRNSDTIAVPIFNEGERVVASLGLTCFISAFGSQNEACERYAPILKAASREISRDLARYTKAQLDDRKNSTAS